MTEVYNTMIRIHMDNTKSIIKDMEQKFSSRDFIWNFMHKHEIEFIDLLNICIKNGGVASGIFHSVNLDIGRFLTEKAPDFKIEKIEELLEDGSKRDKKENSDTVFGTESRTQCWRKIITPVNFVNRSANQN